MFIYVKKTNQPKEKKKAKVKFLKPSIKQMNMCKKGLIYKLK